MPVRTVPKKSWRSQEVKIELDSNLKTLFLNRLREKNSVPRLNLSVSMLIYCLRESFFRITQPKSPSIRQMSFFLDGSKRHVAMEALSELCSEVEVEKYNVRGHVDMLKEEGTPIEFKSTRAKKNLPESYFLQLAFYSLMLNVRHGYLIVQRLMSEDPFEFYKVEWTEEEMMNFDYELFNRANLLRAALEKKDPSLLPKVEAGMNWKCQACLWQSECHL